MSSYTNIKKCRVCGHQNLINILSLGKINVVGFTTRAKKPIAIPLDLALCPKCHLLQLKQTTNPNLLWNAEYGYQSGINNTMKRELKSIINKAEHIIKLKKGDIVIDIGCNDGTLLNFYSKKQIYRVGYDPSHNVISIAHKLLEKYGEDRTILIPNFFSKEPFLKKFKKKAKIITAIAMFYDLDKPNKFLRDVYKCMDNEGMFIIQQNYLLGMLEQNAFDNILHEHLGYYSLTSLKYLMNKNNFEIFDVSKNNINGGSFRTYIRKKGAKVSSKNGLSRVKKMLSLEQKSGLINTKTYFNFAKNVNLLGKKLKDFIQSEVKKSKTVYVYGASTRGNTLLSYYKIDNKLITAAAERNPFKWGKITSGTNIPIISEEEARAQNPDYFLALPWYFKNEFLKREKEFLKRGGKFIFPLPKLEVVGI